LTNGGNYIFKYFEGVCDKNIDAMDSVL